MLFRVFYTNGNQRLIEADTYYQIEEYTKFPEQINLYGKAKWIASAESRLIQAEITVNEVIDIFTRNTSGEPTAMINVIDYETGEVLWRTEDCLKDPDKVCPLHLLRYTVIDTKADDRGICLYV